jgi:hypothetical protein
VFLLHIAVVLLPKADILEPLEQDLKIEMSGVDLDKVQRRDGGCLIHDGCKV